MNKKIIIIILALLILAGVVFAYIYFGTSGNTPSPNNSDQNQPGFQPIGRPSTNNNQNNVPQNSEQNPAQNSTSTSSSAKLPILRLLSGTPVGGYSASTTASTTVVRWVERGRGNVYEAKENSLDVKTLSNTLVPRIYHTVWDKNLNSFIASVLEDINSQKVSTLFAKLNPSPAISTSSQNRELERTPFELKGRNLPNNIIAYAASPKRDRLFMLINENDLGVGYISTFDGKSTTRIFTTPLLQVSAEWPEENTIAILTKANSGQSGFLYSVNPKTGAWKKILGPMVGLSAKVSHDAKYVLASFVGSAGSLITSIYSTANGASGDAVIRTLADKCVWGNFYSSVVYCGVPSQSVNSAFIDDWYKGVSSSNDKIWQVNARTGEVALISSLIDHSDRLIDVSELGTDGRDEYLLFINKNDLSLWSLDMVSSN